MTKKIIVSGEDMLAVRDHLRKQGTYFVAGSNTLSVPSLSAKYMDEKAVKDWPDIDGEIVPMVPGEAARTELLREFGAIRRVGWSGPTIKLLDKRPPMLYSGPQKGVFTYVDLKSAYWQFYRPLWLDTSWPRGYRGKYPLKGVADRLTRWKPARNAVVGMSRARYVYGFRGERRIKLSFTNHFLSPGLWGTVMDLAHWVASVAIEFGAVYINTDGYMFPGILAADTVFFLSWLGEHELDYTIRATGYGEIACWNSYAIGNYKTKPYRLGLKHKVGGFSNVRNETGWSKYRTNILRLVRSGKGESVNRVSVREAGLCEVDAGVS